MTPITTAKPGSFNRARYIATLRATKIKETDGLSILVYLAERCNDDRRLRVRSYKAEVIARAVGISKIHALRRIRSLKAKHALKVIFPSRTAHYQLPTETELQKFA